MRRPDRGGLVYSTDNGRMCPVCRHALAVCSCAATVAAARPRGDGIARIARETGGRGGKVVTIVRGIDADGTALALLGKRLRTALGTGGTTRDGVIEVQGDHRDRVDAWLVGQGFRTRRVGG